MEKVQLVYGQEYLIYSWYGIYWNKNLMPISKMLELHITHNSRFSPIWVLICDINFTHLYIIKMWYVGAYWEWVFARDTTVSIHLQYSPGSFQYFNIACHWGTYCIFPKVSFLRKVSHSLFDILTQVFACLRPFIYKYKNN